MGMKFVVESWIWYSVAIIMVIARFVSRYMHFKSVLKFQIEDWLMLFLACLYTILISFLNVDTDVQTNLIDPAHPPVLTPSEIKSRVWGSKTVLLVEQCMCAVQWGTKCCMLLLYWRLTQNLTQNLVVKCAAIYVATTYIVMEILYFAVWCRPFHDYWQTPTHNVQCTTALHHLIVNLAFNLSSDLLIMSIPLPLFLKVRLEFKRKILLVIPFTMGLFTIICAILSKHLSFTQPFSGEWVFWYCREASTAMIVTNMPYNWALIRRIFKLKSFFGDSTSDGDVPEGGVEEVQGISMGRLDSSGSRARLREHSQNHSMEKKGTWLTSSLPGTPRKMSKPAQQFEDTSANLKTWPRQTDGTDMRDTKEDATASSSNGSSAGYPEKPHTSSGTIQALDKLYPLSDDDLEAPDVTRKYNG